MDLAKNGRTVSDSPDKRVEGPIPGDEVLSVSVGKNGCLEIIDGIGREFATYHRKSREDPDAFLEVVKWVDAWAAERGLVETLDLRGVSLWWFVRNSMIDHFRDQLLDIESVGAAIAEGGSNRLRLENADPYWLDVCQVVADQAGIGFEFVRSTGGPSRAPIKRTKQILASASRAIAGAFRRRHLRRQGGILTLAYTAWRSVIVNGEARCIDPSLELVSDELGRREHQLLKLSAPAAGSLKHQLTWLRRGDAEAVPIEYPVSLWGVLSLFRPGRDSEDRVRRQVRTALSVCRQSPASWKGYDVSILIGRFLETGLLERARRAARLIAFFDKFLGRARPEVMVLCHEYSGIAMAACAAARRQKIPIVAIQHGVIWRAHYGYVLPRSMRDTMPRADVLCVFGDYERRLVIEHGVYAADKVFLTGSPRLDLLSSVPSRIDRNRVVQDLQLPAEAPLLLFTSIGGENSGLIAERLMGFVAASDSPLAIIVKLHPSAETGRELYSAAAAALGLRNVRVVREEYDLYDLFRLVDAHASVYSTSLSEAALFEKPNIMFCTDLFSDTLAYLARNVAVSAESYPSMWAAMEDVLYGAASEKLRLGRQQFVADQFFQLDGEACARIAGIVEQFARQSRQEGSP